MPQGKLGGGGGAGEHGIYLDLRCSSLRGIARLLMGLGLRPGDVFCDVGLGVGG